MIADLLLASAGLAALAMLKLVGTDLHDNDLDRRNTVVNEDKLLGNWKDLKGRVKQAWSKLTDDDIDEIEGKGDQLEGKLQERYGIAREEAKRQIDKFKESL